MTKDNSRIVDALRFFLLAALALATLDLHAGLLNSSEKSAPRPEREEDAAQGPYAPIMKRLRGMDKDAISLSDADYLSKTAASIESVAASFNLRMSAGAAYATLGKFEAYRTIRRDIPNPATFEKDALEACPKCSGKGTEGSPSGEKVRCRTCKGAGWRVKNRELAKQRLGSYLERSIWEISRLNDKWTAEKEEAERAEAERKRKEEELRRAKEREEERRRQAEEQRRKDEEFARKQRAKGLVLYDGKWMTPAERAQAEKRDRFFQFIDNRSINNCVYSILQIIGDGKALCVNRRSGTTFCLLYSTDNAHNRAISEGDVLRNNLWWCGTYTYTTVQNARSTVSMFAIDADVAIREAIRQGYLED